MIKTIYGDKGTGKTRALVESANKMADENYGCVVFIDYSNHLIHNLKHGVRFVNVTEFPIKNEERFLGFLCGIIAQNYDVKWVFIDGITYILKKTAENLENFYSELEQIVSQYDVNFNISVTGDTKKVPNFLKEYIQPI